MILSDKEIRDMIENYKKYKLEAPLIEPFDEERLQGTSYDISMSDKIYRYKNEFRTIDLRNQNEIDSIYDEVSINNGYEIAPKEYILITLNETINLPNNIIAHVRPRTRFTRLGLIVSNQHCNETYSGKLKLGLFNATPYAIKIFPNLKIGQFIFEELKSVPTESKLYMNKQNAIYNNENQFIGCKMNDELKIKAENLYKKILGDLLEGREY
ncbi:TPA: dCTP deaminase [Clostridium perfringens]|uniref:dCTP deaminase n=1 Tax=Clostridium perfringens TaxID=1502 RepID=UPI0028E0D2F2|nr:dCTP deaminase [Clostridium perfringens]MDM0848104.1 dCTP deaminase [Clostridium perfringens]MDM0859433.1 dCTP deaminase [Clostridium perfringens]MDT9332899.1 dCTP deaminase [Clostridium perfringens]